VTDSGGAVSIPIAKPLTILVVPTLLLLATLSGCARTGSATTLITLQRTACFGTCPVYTVRLSSSGLVEYHGEKFVAVEGDRSRQMPPGAFAELAAFAESIEFFSLQDEYRHTIGPDNTVTTVTDLPSRYLSVEKNGETKTVLNYFGGPVSLARFEVLIVELSGIDPWIGSPP
jgi:hypothetical protein